MTDRTIRRLIIWTAIFLSFFFCCNGFAATGDAWVEVAPQLVATYVYGLADYDGKLYGAVQGGELYEWNDVDAWILKAPSPNPGSGAAMRCLLIYGGKLYGGFSRNTGAGGVLYQWNDVDAWIPKTAQYSQRIAALVEYDSKIYGVGQNAGALLEWNGVDAWVVKAPYLVTAAQRGLVVFDNGSGYKIYAAGDGGYLEEWNGVDAWVVKADHAENIASLIVFDNGSGDKIYAGTMSTGLLLEWNGVDAWVEVALQHGTTIGISALCEYDDELYAGTETTGLLLRWNGVDTWTEQAPILNAQAYIRSLGVYDDKLYGGAGALGRLFEWNGAPDVFGQVIIIR